MFEITARYIKKELKKLAFFIQHSSLFESFSPLTRKTLEDLPVEWESVELDGETQLKWQDQPSWKEADLTGKLDDKPLKMKIKKSSSRNIYVIDFDSKKYTVENLNDLRVLFMDLQEGKSPKPQLMQMSYDIISRQKTPINNYSKQYYLSQASQGHWTIDVSKDSSRIFIKFTTPVKSDEEKNNVNGALEEQDKFRMNSIGTYLKKVLKNENVDVSSLDFTHRLLNIPNKAGFLITVK